jgi:predicted DNA-binding protein (MmcQ/YjbR family)
VRHDRWVTIDDAHIERLRAICTVLPEVTEVETFDNPTFRVATKAFAVFERANGAPVVSVKSTLDDQAALVAREAFEVAAYTGHHGWTNVRLDLDVDWTEIDELLIGSYRLQAPKRLRVALDDLLAAAGEEPLEVDEPVDLTVPTVSADRRVIELLQVVTPDSDAVAAAEVAWRDATEGRRAPSRIVHARDGDRHLLTIEYASADDADSDAALPESADLLVALGALAGGPVEVTRYEVVRTDRR